MLFRHLSDLPWFVVASEQGHLVRPPRLEHHQPGEGLQAVVAPVHKVPHEDVVGLWRWTPSPDVQRIGQPKQSHFENLPEEFFQVIELPMNIPTNSHRWWYWIRRSSIENQTTCSHLVEHWILPKADHKPSHKAASTLAPEDTEEKNYARFRCKIFVSGFFPPCTAD